MICCKNNFIKLSNIAEEFTWHKLLMEDFDDSPKQLHFRFREFSVGRTPKTDRLKSLIRIVHSSLSMLI